MPPPKVKLHKTSGKARPGPPKISQINNAINITESGPSTSSGDSASHPAIGLTTEQEQQFQSELYWCIKQLQAALSKDKLPNKQVQEHTKALNTLISHTAPLVKKRQVMRLSFGDYRKKMLEDEKKTKQLSIEVSAGKPSDKSVFLRKAIVNSSGDNFKFNFSTPEKDSSQLPPPNQENLMETETTQNKMNGAFTQSSNSFRFNFTNDEPQNASES